MNGSITKKREKVWFTIEFVDEDTVAISEYSHWENAHSYLISDGEDATLIDTSLGIGSMFNIVSEIIDFQPRVVTSHGFQISSATPRFSD